MLSQDTLFEVVREDLARIEELGGGNDAVQQNWRNQGIDPEGVSAVSGLVAIASTAAAAGDPRQALDIAFSTGFSLGLAAHGRLDEAGYSDN